MVYHAFAGPFWRMRQFILANAPIHFIECAYLFWRKSRGIRVFRYSGIQVFRYPGYNTTATTTPTTITTGLWWHGGVRKGRFQQLDTAHSGTGEKKTLNINVVGKTIYIYCLLYFHLLFV